MVERRKAGRKEGGAPHERQAGNKEFIKRAG